MLADVLQGSILTDDAISRVATALDVSEDPEEFRYFRAWWWPLRYWVADGFVERYILRVDGVRQILWRWIDPTLRERRPRHKQEFPGAFVAVTAATPIFRQPGTEHTAH